MFICATKISSPISFPTKPDDDNISDEAQTKESAISAGVPEVQESPRPTAFPIGALAAEVAAEANQAAATAATAAAAASVAGAEKSDPDGGGGGGRRSVAAALNVGIAPTASPESPSPTEQNLPRVLWDRPVC